MAKKKQQLFSADIERINPSFTEEIYVSRNRVQTFLAWLDGENVTIQ